VETPLTHTHAKEKRSHTLAACFFLRFWSVGEARSRAFWLCLWSGKKHSGKNKGI